MVPRVVQPLLWLGLAVSLVVFYTSFVTARTYYNPTATMLIIVLASVIVVTGTALTKLPPERRLPAIRNRFVLRTLSAYTVFFMLAALAIFGDVVSTLYAISTYGLSAESNGTVAGLLRTGQILSWLGQQFAPLFIAGAIFGLVKNIYVRSLMAFYTIGTFGYALATVLNNAAVIYRLGAIS